jgi:hypothetical protein
MSGTRRKGFAWKEIADVLRMPQRPSSAVFWREIKRSRPNNVETKRPASGTQEEQRNSDTRRRPDKTRTSR